MNYDLEKNTNSEVTERFLIMVVDDVPENIQIVLKILENKKYSFCFAIDGQSAWKTIQATAPDLILLDIMLPDTNGYEICRKIKQDSNYNHIPVIFLSAKSERQDVIKSYEVGGIDYIMKPFEEIEVQVKVNTQIELIRLKRKLFMD